MECSECVLANKRNGGYTLNDSEACILKFKAKTGCYVVIILNFNNLKLRAERI